MTVVDALQAALAVEHQAVYGYGLAASHLTARARNRALAELVAAEARRDRLGSLVQAHGQTPVAPSPAYVPRTPVTDAASAVALCRQLDDASAGAAWDLAAASAADSPERELAVSWIGAAAVSAAQWAGGVDKTAALPGEPA